MFTDYFINRPVLSLVISTMIVLLGVQAFFNVQVRQYPELETSVISITTAYPGANPASPQPHDTLGLNGYENRLKVAGVKLMLDGSPQGKTAFLTQPYHVAPHGKDEHYAGYPAQELATVAPTSRMTRVGLMGCHPPLRDGEWVAHGDPRC